MDNLIKSCLSINKAINTRTSLPEARKKIEAFLLDILNYYAAPDLFKIWIEETETEKFIKENVGRTVSLTGSLNENCQQISRAEFCVWKVILEGKYRYATDDKIEYTIPPILRHKYYPDIKIILKESACLRGGDIVTITGVLGVSTDPKCPYVVHSADLLKYERGQGSHGNGLEERLDERKRWLRKYKKEFTEIEELIRIGKTKQGRPFSMRYLETLKHNLYTKKESISRSAQEVKELKIKIAIAHKYGADAVNGIEKIEHLKTGIASEKQSIEKLQQRLQTGISIRGITKGRPYSKTTIQQIKRDIKFWEDCIKNREEEIKQLSDTETVKAQNVLLKYRKENNHLRLVRG